MGHSVNNYQCLRINDNRLSSIVPNARLLFVTVLVFTWITIVIHQNITSATLVCFIQLRGVVCVFRAAVQSVFHTGKRLMNNHRIAERSCFEAKYTLLSAISDAISRAFSASELLDCIRLLDPRTENFPGVYKDLIENRSGNNNIFPTLWKPLGYSVNNKQCFFVFSLAFSMMVILLRKNTNPW